MGHFRRLKDDLKQARRENEELVEQNEALQAECNHYFSLCHLYKSLVDAHIQQVGSLTNAVETLIAIKSSKKSDL